MKIRIVPDIYKLAGSKKPIHNTRHIYIDERFGFTVKRRQYNASYVISNMKEFFKLFTVGRELAVVFNYSLRDV